MELVTCGGRGMDANAFHQFRVGSTGLSDAPESSIASSSLSSAMQMPATQGDPNHPESSVYANGSRKAPYGAGDADEGYTLTFESMATFEAWRVKEEEEKMIEFVRNDRHVSKSSPPRFKEHTKLVRSFFVRVGCLLKCD